MNRYFKKILLCVVVLALAIGFLPAGEFCAAENLQTWTDDFASGKGGSYTPYGYWWNKDGQLTVGDSRSVAGVSYYWLKDYVWDDFVMEFDVINQTTEFGVIFRAQQTTGKDCQNQGYGVLSDTNWAFFMAENGKFSNLTTMISDGIASKVDGYGYAAQPGTSNVHWKIMAEGNRIEVYFNHAETPQMVMDATLYQSGAIGFRTNNPGGTISAVIDNLSITQIEREKPVQTATWIDDFSSGKAGFYTPYGYWWNKNGQLTIGDPAALKGVCYYWLKDYIWKDFTMEFDVINQTDAFGVILRAQKNTGSCDQNQGYGVLYDTNWAFFMAENGKFSSLDTLISEGHASKVSGYGWAAKPGTQNVHWKIVAKGDRIEVYFNYAQTPQMVMDTTLYDCGSIGFRAYNSGGAVTAVVENLSIIGTVESAPQVDAPTDINTAVTGWNVVLGDRIGVNLSAKLRYTDTVKCYIGENEIDSTTTFSNGIHKISAYVAAAQMADPITVKINGEALTKTYCVRSYADYILNGDYSDNIKSLVKAMLNYGAASQTYFAHNTDTLANDGIAVALPAIPTESNGVEVEGGIDGVRFYGASLVHKEKLAVRYYFTAKNVEGITFCTAEKSYTAIEKDGKYYVEIGGINPQDMDENITLTVSDGTNTLFVAYAPVDYIVRMYHKADVAQTTKALVQALYGYYLAAEIYTAQPVSLALGWDKAESSGEVISVTANMQAVNMVQPGIFGANVSWRGNGYGQWDAENNCPDATLLQMLKDSGVTHLRYPGGIEGDYFHWMESVGENRIAQIDPFSFSYPTYAPNDGERYVASFGPDEFLTLCQAAGDGMTIQLNAGNGTAAEAAQWVRYYQQKNADVWSFCVGNEVCMAEERVDGMTVTCTPQEYVDFYNAVYAELGDDVNELEFGCIGITPSHPLCKYRNWDSTVLTQLGDKIDFIDVHIGYSPYFTKDETDEEIVKCLLASSVFVRRLLDEEIGLIQSCAGEYADDISIQITEWGPIGGHASSVAGSVYMASFMETVLAEPKVSSACYLPLINHPRAANLLGAQINPNAAGEKVYWDNCNSIVFRWYAEQVGRQVLSANITGGETFDSVSVGLIPALTDVPVGSGSVYYDPETKEGSIFLINKSFDENVTFSVKVPYTNITVTAVTELWNENPVAGNKDTAPNTVCPSSYEAGQTVPYGYIQVETKPVSIVRVDFVSE